MVNINCQNSKKGATYPNNVPRPKNGCKKVNSGARIKGDKIKIFEDYYSKSNSLPDDKALAISDTLGLPIGDVKNMTGTEILSAVKAANKINPRSVQYHHIRPDWAGGKNTGDNLVPISKTPMHTGEGSAHRWWSSKLDDKKDSIQKDIDACLKKNNEKPLKKQHTGGEKGMKATASELKKRGLPFTLCLQNCKN